VAEHKSSRRSANEIPAARHETVPELPAVIGPAQSQDISLASIPVVVVPTDLLAKLPLDAREGFVLSLIDGKCSLEEVIDMCAFERIETIDIVAGFIQTGIVLLRAQPPSSKPPSGRGA
jgi:hypothetical protein